MAHVNANIGSPVITGYSEVLPKIPPQNLIELSSGFHVTAAMLDVLRHCITLLLIVALAVLPVGRSSFAENDILLPDIGDPSGRLLTPIQEQQLGDAFFRGLHSRIRINQDLEIHQFIASLGERLAVNSDNSQQPFHFFVVLDPIINAFAGPGGYIGINSGLILATESESEMASVMAHEIAHVTQRHLFRAFDAARKLTIPSAVALLAALLVSTQSAELGQAALIAAQAGNAQYQIDFTRDNEQEADRVGMKTLARTNFNPRSMPTFFERLQQSSRYYADGPPEFLRTHPVTTSRISDTRGRAEKYPYRQFPDSIGYQLLKAKLRVITAAKPSKAIQHFKSKLDRGTPTQKAVAHYGYALALAADNRYAQAQPILRNLRRQNPEQAMFINALAKTELRSGNTLEALRLYRQALEQFPGNRAVTLDYATALLANGKSESARKLLSDDLRHHNPSPQVYNLVSRAYDDLGQKAQSHRYLAEYHYVMGQVEPAIFHARLGLQEAAGNYYLTAMLEDRLKLFVEEKEQLEKQKPPIR